MTYSTLLFSINKIKILNFVGVVTHCTHDFRKNETSNLPINQRKLNISYIALVISELFIDLFYPDKLLLCYSIAVVILALFQGWHTGNPVVVFNGQKNHKHLSHIAGGLLFFLAI